MTGTRVVTLLAAGCVLWCGWAVSEALGQKGIGDPTGVARQAVKPEVVSLSGKITDVKSGPCELTTGRAVIGTHVLLETDKGKSLNVHLGPQAVVADVAARLKVGETLAVKAFHTGKMSEGHYVAQSLELGDETIALRDAGTLRPGWAGAPAVRRAWGGYRPGGGYGYAQGRAGDWRGTWACPRWGGPPQGQGPGWGAPSRGPGRGFGPCYGRGRRGGRGMGRGSWQGQGRGPGSGAGAWW